MKCTIKAEYSKQKFLTYARNCLKCIYDSNYIYGLYDYKSQAYRDSFNLKFGKIKNEIYRGWKFNGVNLKNIETV